MELANAILTLWSRKWLVFAVLLVSVVAGTLLAFDVKTSPLGLERKGLQIGTASTDVYLDTRDPAIDSLSTKFDPFTQSALIQRAHTLGRIMPSFDIRERIARRMGVQPQDIAITPPSDPVQSGTRAEPSGSQRALAIVSAASDFQITVEDSTQAPTLTIVGQTTDPDLAGRLVDSTVTALRAYLQQQRNADGAQRRRNRQTGLQARLQRSREVIVQRNGPAVAGTLTTGANIQLAIAGAISTFIVGCLLILGLGGLATSLRRARHRTEIDAVSAAALEVRAASTFPSAITVNGNGNGHPALPPGAADRVQASAGRAQDNA